MLLIAIPLGIAIGLVVGTVGGGGAILAFPILVYLLDQPVGPASTASLIVVALAAAVGAGPLALQGQVCWRVAFTFSAPAAAGALAGAVANAAISPGVLLLAFVPVMLSAAAATWKRAGSDHARQAAGCPRLEPRRIVAAGFGVGLMTGLFGVGGGFIIVPVLTLWLGSGFRHAVATSLVIITLTGIAAVASHLIAGAAIDAGVTAALAGATAAGALAGSVLGGRLPQATLARGFALVVALVGLGLLVDVVVLGGPPGG